jgi:hypothetical protein
MSALRHPQDMFSVTAIQLQPVFAQWIQNTHSLAPSETALGATANTSLTWGGDDLVAVGASCFVTYSIRNRGFFWSVTFMHLQFM